MEDGDGKFEILLYAIEMVGAGLIGIFILFL